MNRWALVNTVCSLGWRERSVCDRFGQLVHVQHFVSTAGRWNDDVEVQVPHFVVVIAQIDELYQIDVPAAFQVANEVDWLGDLYP